VPPTSLPSTSTRLLGPNGVFILTGVPGPEPPAPFDASGLMRRLVLGNQTIVGTVNAGRSTYERAVDDLGAFHRRWSDQLDKLITARHPLAQAPELLLGRASGIKDVVSIGVGAAS
jgi:threonine dehydrogenase-like Zn-dependent dehydrogenase